MERFQNWRDVLKFWGSGMAANPGGGDFSPTFLVLGYVAGGGILDELKSIDILGRGVDVWEEVLR